MKLIACIIIIISVSGEMDSSINTRPIINNFLRLGKLEIRDLRIPSTKLSVPTSRLSDIILTDLLKEKPLDIPQSISVRGGSTKSKKKRRNNTGFYYGIKEDIFFPPCEKTGLGSLERNDQRGNEPTTTELAEIMGTTLLELREMREDLSGLREEMQYMKEEFKRSFRHSIEDELGEEPKDRESESSGRSNTFVGRRKRQREFEAIGAEVEKWAYEILFEQNGEENGWKEIKCNKAVKNKFNRNGVTSCFVKWMKDSRGKKGNPNDDQEYPCIRCYSTVNAPLEHVCAYLSKEEHCLEYNDLLVNHRELEEISPNSKVCWAQSPQILFIKARDFVSYCQYRWKRDGTQIVVNQACEHDEALGNEKESEGKICRAAALRGANFISRDPDDPNKTRFALLAHANPGGGLPHWAMKAAVNALLPIEPFKLFYKIDTRVNALGDSLRETLGSSSVLSSRPAGLSQMGYACFWPARDTGLKGDEGSRPKEIVEVIDDDVATAVEESPNEYEPLAQ